MLSPSSTSLINFLITITIMVNLLASPIPGIKAKKLHLLNVSNDSIEQRNGHDKSVEVITIVDGTVTDVLPLIGYQQHDLNWLTDSDGVLRVQPQVVQRLEAIAKRKQGVYMLQEGQRLFGVVVDSAGGVQVIGHVKYLLPGEHQDKHYSGVSVKMNSDWQLCNPQDYPDVEGIVTQHGHVGVVHFSGFCLVEVKPEVLALLLEDAYFILPDGFIDGFKSGECLLVANGAIVKRSLMFELVSGGSKKVHPYNLLSNDKTISKIKVSKKFPESVLKEASFYLNWRIPLFEHFNRRSFTHVLIFTLDSEVSKDLDDAISIIKLLNGLHKLCVHVADVSYFIRPGSELEQEARFRRKTFYASRELIKMLPEQISKTASLTPNEDKLGMTFEWIVDGEGKVVSQWFGRTIVRSYCKLTHKVAETMIANPNKEWSNEELQVFGKWTASDVSRDLNLLNKISIAMRKRRFPDRKRLKFDSKTLIEEFMHLANRSAAELLLQLAGPRALLRQNSKYITGEELLPNTELYTQFSCPLRRFPDIIVHRGLLIAYKINDGPVLSLNAEEMRLLKEYLNEEYKN